MTREQATRHAIGAAIVLLLIPAILAVVLFSGMAHADSGASQYDHWHDTNGWHGETRRQGRTTDWTTYGPRGEQRSCHQFFVGEQPFTTCH